MSFSFHFHVLFLFLPSFSSALHGEVKCHHCKIMIFQFDVHLLVLTTCLLVVFTEVTWSKYHLGCSVKV